jgi:hypothetical protein
MAQFDYQRKILANGSQNVQPVEPVPDPRSERHLAGGVVR